MIDKAICEANNVSVNTIRMYMKRHNCSFEDAIKAHKSKPKSFAQMCRDAGVSQRRAYAYLYDHDVSEEDAIEWAKKPYKTLPERCTELGIDIATVRRNRSYFKCSIEDAIVYTIDNSKLPKNSDDSVALCAKAADVPVTEVKKVMDSFGYSVEAAILYVKSHIQMKKLCASFGVDPIVVRRYMTVHKCSATVAIHSILGK